jgi:ATP-dependent exoDNAse (exonuclease V) beta subunit
MPTEYEPSVEDITRTYIKIRDTLSELTAQYKADEQKLKEQLDVLRGALLDYCATFGVESARTAHGTFYRTTKTRYWTSDWESMHRFIMDHQVPEFFEKRLNQTAVREFLEENPDQFPPGLNTDVEYVINVRRK